MNTTQSPKTREQLIREKLPAFANHLKICFPDNMDTSFLDEVVPTWTGAEIQKWIMTGLFPYKEIIAKRDALVIYQLQQALLQHLNNSVIPRDYKGKPIQAEDIGKLDAMAYDKIFLYLEYFIVVATTDR